jgi:oxygen-independent coproporphyrinogen-3 oxidase
MALTTAPSRLTDTEASEAEASRGETGAGLAAGLYLHIPFCRTKCHYCDFNTYAGIEDLMPAYVAALGQEIAHGAAETDRAGRVLVSVFFGGGTPSLLSGRQIGALLDIAARTWGLPAGVEVTLEANPGTLTPAALADLRAAGVNRLSLGAQSLQSAGLAALGREHDVAAIVASVAAARAAGFDNLNLDLIYGWMGQGLIDWHADLDAVGALSVEHLSLYPLTVEAGTPLARQVAQGLARVADDDAMADRYALAVDRLALAGYVQYEVSNWAQRDAGAPLTGPGSTPRRACRHNLLYWRNEEYWGGGPGAHSHWSGRRWMNLKSPRQYIERAQRGATLVADSETITTALAMAETLLLGLRLSEGVSLTRFAARHGARAEVVYADVLADLTATGDLERHGDTLVIPQARRYLLDGIVARFLPEA